MVWSFQELLTEFLHNKAIRKELVRGARTHALHHSHGGRRHHKRSAPPSPAPSKSTNANSDSQSTRVAPESPSRADGEQRSGSGPQAASGTGSEVQLVPQKGSFATSRRSNAKRGNTSTPPATRKTANGEHQGTTSKDKDRKRLKKVKQGNHHHYDHGHSDFMSFETGATHETMGKGGFGSGSSPRR